MAARAMRVVPLKCHIPLDAVPKPLLRRMRRAEKYINSLGVHIDKIQMPPSSELSVSEPALVVGSVLQYPQMTHFNEATILRLFAKDRLSRSSWSFDSTVTEAFGTTMTTAIDYYPFRNSETAGPSKSAPKKSGTRGASTKWKVRRRGYNINRRDSFSEVLPRLSRDGQELVIYRDVPYDLQSAVSVIPILNEFAPDAVVLEYGRIPFVDQLLLKRTSFSKLALPIKKVHDLKSSAFNLEICGREQMDRR